MSKALACINGGEHQSLPFAPRPFTFPKYSPNLFQSKCSPFTVLADFQGRNIAATFFSNKSCFTALERHERTIFKSMLVGVTERDFMVESRNLKTSSVRRVIKSLSALSPRKVKKRRSETS